MAYRKQNNRNKVLDVILGIAAVVVLALATLFTLEVTGTVDFKGMIDDEQPVEEVVEEQIVEEPVVEETPEDEVDLLTFRLYYSVGEEVASFNFEEGMTWEEFINSEYNVNGLFSLDGAGISVEYNGNYVYSEEMLVANVELNEPINSSLIYYIS